VIEQANTHQRALAEMIERGRFAVVYQPVVRLVDRRVHHYEALLRPLPDPGNPAANPQEFVTLVEAVGLSVELDLAVLRRALGALRQGRERIAVNVSGLSIADPRFEARVLRKLAGIGSGRLLIELTETAEIEDLATVAARVARIRAAGVPICLDDFGAGNASFRYLRDLRVDFVKIDGAYVRAAAGSDQGRAFVRSMRDLAVASGAQTIAELIETEADAALMQDLGVDFGQGWLFGRPGELPDTAAAGPLAAPAKAANPKLERWKY
jgi:EAL domain-containing protein (putative c-di-GMP-specific phosphodiesterase class I)